MNKKFICMIFAFVLIFSIQANAFFPFGYGYIGDEEDNWKVMESLLEDLPANFDEPGFVFDLPFDEPPIIIPPIFPPIPPINYPARWNHLHNVDILQGTEDNTMIYQDLALQCYDPDDEARVTVRWNSEDFSLFFSKYDLKIKNLDPRSTGTFTVTAICNKISTKFKLNILPEDEYVGPVIPVDNELMVSSIFIENSENAKAGNIIPLNIVFKNSGNKKLENIKVTAIIAELGARTAVGPFDLKKGNKIQKTLFLELPEWVIPITYYLRLGIYNNDIKRIVYREINVEE